MFLLLQGEVFVFCWTCVRRKGMEQKGYYTRYAPFFGVSFYGQLAMSLKFIIVFIFIWLMTLHIFYTAVWIFYS
ncbi:hypothetical protein GIB67_011483 [Kingdonia uniflora]|uniref:Uncharacterized protein n=1 Tax=Kingdonia uniflora TaxID=39325 RepID=A0A7J7NMC8_9MAGN|nr:hypothetical protein GIB67_011483 [Kingdonia uniflora]